MARLLMMLAVTFLVSGTSGCKKDPSMPATVSVAGKITLKGQPLADTNIYFLHPGSKFTSFAKTDASGAYRLVQGAVPGENKVAIIKPPPATGADPAAGLDEGQFEAVRITSDPRASAGKTESQIPKEYAEIESSPLKYNVPEGGTQTANFDL